MLNQKFLLWTFCTDCGFAFEWLVGVPNMQIFVTFSHLFCILIKVGVFIRTNTVDIGTVKVHESLQSCQNLPYMPTLCKLAGGIFKVTRQKNSWRDIFLWCTSRIFLFHGTPAITVMILSFRTDRPGQTVQTQCRSTLFAIPSASFGLITLWWSHIVQILEWL